MSDATDSAKETALWPYVLQFSLVYLLATIAAEAIIYATGWQTTTGINLAILVASVVWPMHRFVREQGRPLTRGENLRFAALSLVTSSLLWPAVSAAAIALIVGPDTLVSLVSGFQHVGPGYLIVLVGMWILGCLVNFAVLYFIPGMLSRAFHRRFAPRGAS